MSDDDRDKPVNLDQIRQLVDLLIEKDIAEFELDQRGVKVKIRRMDGARSAAAAPAASGSVPSPTPVPESTVTSAAPVAPEAQPEEEAEPLSDAHVVSSPIVGTFYRAPEPGADPFVELGDAVEEGQTLCIVEAMKLMNEIASDIAGEVVGIFVENGEPVEYGQELFAIQPSS